MRLNNKFKFVIACTLILASCSHKKAATKDETTKEVRLTKDRTQLEKLRKNVPEEVQEFNDETSYILSLFADPNKSPYDISNRFNDQVRRKRDDYSKIDRKQREEFNRDEKKKREDFLEELKKKREKKEVSKMSSSDRNRYFSEIDTERRRYFGDESDTRREFDSKMRQERQDFEAHMRDMRARFDQEYKVYSKNYFDRKKLESKKEQMGQQTPTGAQKNPSASAVPPGFTEQDMKDLDSIPKAAKPIEPAEGQ